MAVKYLDNAGTQYLVNKIKAIDGKIPTESQITTMITTALNTYKEGIVTIVESLPQTGEEGKLYLMVDPSDSDVYIIYTWEENAFKRMGSKTFTLTVDSALSATSTNPVQNKVIKSALDGKANASHTHGSITNDGKLGTASRVVITGTDKKIGISTVTTTELGYLSGVTSAIQTQLDGKSATGHTHTAGDVAGLATVATSGSYNDLSSKPSIPTKTSDLTNDSNFVDTSNPAVASGITSAKVTSYDAHVADTDIHVTTADKNKWNNQTFVFRYSSTALVASSTNSNTLLDNTDNLKVGDKVIDSNGVLFSVTAIDTANSTFTIGTALVDLAQDSDVVHKSGNETVGGNKTFTGTNEILRPSGDHKLKITDTRVTPLDPTGSITSNITWQDSTGRLLGTVANVYDNSGNSIMQLYARSFNANDEHESHKLRIISNKGGYSYADVDVNFLPSSDNKISLGSSTLRWNGVYATNYYYGSNNVEFSTKFVTTDTNQIISGAKTFSDTLTIYNSDSSQNTKNLTISSSKIQVGDTSNNDAFGIRLNAGASYVAQILAVKDTSGTQNLQLDVRTKDSSNNLISSMARLRLYTNGYSTFEPNVNTSISLGSPSNKWNKINGVEPSSLSLPSDRSARIDISSYFTNTGTGNTNDYSVPANGYIFLNLLNAFAVICYSIDGTNNVNYAQSYFRPVDGQIYILFPVRKNDTFRTLWTANGGTITVTGAHFIPCQGNV